MGRHHSVYTHTVMHFSIKINRRFSLEIKSQFSSALNPSLSYVWLTISITGFFFPAPPPFATPRYTTKYRCQSLPFRVINPDD